ncbi:uncharacterized protein M6B38_287165 [Iris pallida]|uniref:AT5G11810-like protein n=1 Tax=Iris pallida TaxID=29817 RepID=A0AAX6HX49_IRIPA|nr:uncharacterized protein M6B38_287165 [Iris pallida]
MADKPSRALVIYGDGVAPAVSPSHSHLHSFASRASCGFLSLRNSLPDEAENDRAIRELAQLLDAYDFGLSRIGKHGEVDAVGDSKEISLPSISERFMGLRAAISTDCPIVGSFARSLGFDVLQLDKHFEEVPDKPISSESKLLSLLGFSEGNVQEKCEFDLVLLHIKAGENSKDQKKLPGSTVADWLDRLVGGIMETAQPGSSIASRLHCSIVLSYGTISEGLEQCSLTTNSSVDANPDLDLLRPHQSYTMKGGNVLCDIRHDYPMLVAQWQEGVTRKDMANAFSFQEFKEHGGNLAILADRFLHEVAFKLWKAPKYGA